MSSTHRILLAMFWITFPACGDDDSGKESVECSRGVVESDYEPDVFMGPGVSPDGKLVLDPNKEYTVSATYGQPVPGPDGAPVTQMYVDIFGDISTTLMNSPGLVAFTLASSDSCGSGRTLGIWESEGAMYEFVMSPAHLKAMSNANKLLKPGYAVTHFSAQTANQMTFQEGAKHLAEVEGR